MMDSEVEDKPKKKAKTNPRDTLGFWLKWIKDSRKAAKRHIDDARAAWREYENQNDLGSEVKRENQEVPLCYPAYWSACKTIEPAYYSRTPNPQTQADFGWEDGVAETACIVAERIGKYQIRKSGFDGALAAAVQDFIHADKATVQVIPDIDPEGQELPSDPAAEESGEPQYGAVCESIRLAPITYDEILHTPNAKVWEEVREIAIRFQLPEDEAIERFGDKIPATAWKVGTPSGDDRATDDEHGARGKEPIGKYLEGWECWDSVTETVRWVSEQLPSEFLDTKPDPYQLPGFFPVAPFIIGSKPSKSLYPTPAYIQLLPTIRQLHLAYARTFKLLRSARRRAVVDGASPELITALNDLDENEFVAAQNLNDIVAKGGLDKMIFYVPIAELVAAIKELQQIRDGFKAEMYEFFGVPDIIRGVSDPIETLGTNEMKRDAAHDRFRYAKKQVAQLASNGLNLLIDLTLRLYSDEQIARIAGFRFMTPEQQQAFPEALAILRDNEEEVIRTDIEADSLAFIDQRLRAEQRAIVIKTVSDGLKSVADTIKIDITLGTVQLQLLLATLDGMEGGKYFLDEVKAAGKKLIDAIQAPPQGPPPPDYEMLKIQNEASKIGLEQQRFQLEEQRFDWQKQTDTSKIQLDEAIQNAKINIANQQTEIQGLKVQNQAQIEATRQELEAGKLQFKQAADTLLLELERVRTSASIQESAQEEYRLMREQKLQELQTLLDHHVQKAQLAHQRIQTMTDHIQALTDHINAMKPDQSSPTDNMEQRAQPTPVTKTHEVMRDSAGRITHIKTTTE